MVKANIDGDDFTVDDKFYVRTASGSKISDLEQQNLRNALAVLLASKSVAPVASGRPKFDEETGHTNVGSLMVGAAAVFLWS